MTSARQLIRRVVTRLHPGAGCSDGSCVFGSPGGMHTNGGCECLKERNPMQLKRNLMIMADVAWVLAAVKEDET